MESLGRTLYLYRHGDRCYSHDGHIQLGYHPHSIERHIELSHSIPGPKINWIETHWLPDVFAKRYKRATFQTHSRVSGEKSVLESKVRRTPGLDKVDLTR